jgi:hypothetical protein
MRRTTEKGSPVVVLVHFSDHVNRVAVENGNTDLLLIEFR